MVKIDDFFSGGDGEFAEKVLKELFSDENLDTKSDLPSPINFAGLRLLANYCEEEDFKETAKVINDFCDMYIKYMISHKRKSRTEFVKAFQSLQERKEPNLRTSLIK